MSPRVDDAIVSRWAKSPGGCRGGGRGGRGRRDRGAEGEAGDDAVAVAAVDRVDVLDGPARRVRGEAFEEQGRGEFGDVEEFGLGPGDDGRLDRLDRLLDVYAVLFPQVFVQVTGLQLLGGQGGNQIGPDVQMLDGHRGAVDQAQPRHVHDLGGGRET